MPDVFGMGNLRIAYLHNLLHSWLGDAGDIVEFGCEFRGLNLAGDTLTCTATVTGEERRDGHDLVTLDLGVRNQDGVDTTPGSATVVRFGPEGAAMPEPPPPSAPSGDAAPGTFLDQATIDRIGRSLAPVAAPPVGANDIARWAIATHWPEPAPAAYLDPDVAARGAVGRDRRAPRLRSVRLDAEPALGRRLALGHGHRTRQAPPQRWPAQHLRHPDPPRRRHRRHPPVRRRGRARDQAAAPWSSSPASSAGRTRTAPSSASASRPRSTTEPAPPPPASG